MIYPFVSLDEKETIDLHYPIKEAPSIGSIVVHEGREWRRVFAIPSPTYDSTIIDPNSALAFEKSNDGKRYTLGDVWDKSAEMSARRASKYGSDPVKQAYYDNYAKSRKGARHPNELKERQAKQSQEASNNLRRLGRELGLS